MSLRGCVGVLTFSGPYTIGEHVSFGWALPANSIVPTCRRSGPVLLLALLTACGGDLMLPPAGGPSVIRVVTGDGQTGVVGQLLGEPLVVEVTDPDSLPVHEATVVFELTSAGQGAKVLPDTTFTGTDGRAEAHLLLGDKVGVQTGEARVVVAGGAAPVVPFSATATATTPGTPENRPPQADFHWHCEDLDCQFTDASTDSDGNIIAWSWQFGDGTSSAETGPRHQFAAAGIYSVTLTVTDNGAATDQTTSHVEVNSSSPPPPEESNHPPHAEFEVHCEDLDCSFSDKSRDDDGAVTSWLWQFGDGFISVEQNPDHSYSSKGHYQVTLTVTDDDGASDSRSHDAKVKD
jgi:PKD repeat protein